MATMKNRVLWQEGMFALPQHFQQQQRHNDAMLRERLDALGDFAWGFTELSLNTELLAQGKVMIDRAAGCLPDGTVFRIPEQDLLPQPFQPRELNSPVSHDIYLALPVATHNISEVQGVRSAGQSSERYSIVRTDVRDVHSDDGDMQ
ncbi:type VI secretion system baseplate subunit TssK, partial [Salmonella enterica]